MKDNEIKSIEKNVDNLLNTTEYLNNDDNNDNSNNFEYDNKNHNIIFRSEESYKKLYEKQLLINKSLFEEFNRKVNHQKEIYESHVNELNMKHNDEIFNLRKKVQNLEDLVRVNNKGNLPVISCIDSNLEGKFFKLLIVFFIIFVLMYLSIKYFKL